MEKIASQKSSGIIQAVKDYGRQLSNFIRGRVSTNEEAEDILQDVWYQFSNVADIDTIDSVSGWLHQVARNRITDNFRKKKTTSFDDQPTSKEGSSFIKDMLISDSASPDEKMMRDLFWEVLFEALDELPENQREVFVLNELEDHTLQEIADMQNENLKTIISRKGYAVKHLRYRLENMYNEFLKSMIMGAMKHRKYWLWTFVAIAFLALGTWAVMLLWNNVVIDVIPQVKTLTYWQALGLLALCKILFGGGPRGGWKRGNNHGGRRHWREKWGNMSEEEKLKMKEQWKKRCEKWNE